MVGVGLVMVGCSSSATNENEPAAEAEAAAPVDEASTVADAISFEKADGRRVTPDAGPGGDAVAQGADSGPNEAADASVDDAPTSTPDASTDASVDDVAVDVAPTSTPDASVDDIAVDAPTSTPDASFDDVAVDEANDSTSGDASGALDDANADSAEVSMPAPCTAGTTACATGSVIVCGADGFVASTTMCPLGCEVDHCLTHLRPSNVTATVCSRTGLADKTFTSGSLVVDATHCPGESLTQSDGSKICMLVAHNVTVPAGQTLAIQATATATPSSIPFVIVATGILSVSGTIDMRGLGHVPTGALGEHHGAGGSYATRGGGSYYYPLGGFTPATTDPGLAFGSVQLSPILPGENGYIGYSNLDGGRGGLAGGALQLVGCEQVNIGSSAVVNANGRGGRGGPAAYDVRRGFAAGAGGGGGGSGGAILIETPLLVIVAGATIGANGGGGGGGGDPATGTNGLAGAEGPLSVDVAAGGTAFGIAGTGGTGGAAVTRPTAGARPNSSTVNSRDYHGGSGGGGGSVGRIRINLPAGAIVPSGAVISPPASIGIASGI